jgi:hypothetical protein
METVRIRDPGWKKVGSGIRDKHPGSATLVGTNFKIKKELQRKCSYEDPDAISFQKQIKILIQIRLQAPHFVAK